MREQPDLISFEELFQKVLSFFKKEYDNTIVNVGVISVRTVGQMVWMSMLLFCALVMFAFALGCFIGALSSFIVGVASWFDALALLFLSLLFSGLTLYCVTAANRVLKYVSRDHFREMLELLKVKQKLYLKEAALELEIGPRKAKSVLEGMCDMGLCELHITQSGQLVYALKELCAEDKKTSEKPEF